MCAPDNSKRRPAASDPQQVTLYSGLTLAVLLNAVNKFLSTCNPACVNDRQGGDEPLHRASTQHIGIYQSRNSSVAAVSLQARCVHPGTCTACMLLPLQHPMHDHFVLTHLGRTSDFQLHQLLHAALLFN